MAQGTPGQAGCAGCGFFAPGGQLPYTQSLGAEGHPSGAPGATAGVADIAQSRAAECGKLSVTGLFDAGKGFVDALEELRVIRRAWRQAGRQFLVGDREAFADGGKG